MLYLQFYYCTCCMRKYVARSFWVCVGGRGLNFSRAHLIIPYSPSLDPGPFIEGSLVHTVCACSIFPGILFSNSLP